MRIAFNIHINSPAGFSSIPQLLQLFDNYQLPAHFFVALGKDIGEGFLAKQFAECWLDKNLNARMGRKFKEQILSLKSAGHEVGITAMHPRLWNEQTPFRSEEWIKYQLQTSHDAYQEIFHCKPLSHAAHQWQTHEKLFQIETELNFDFAADVRGKYAFYPEFGTMQIPTSLPTFRELQNQQISHDELHEEMFYLSQPILPTGHILHIDAGYDVHKLYSTLEACLVMWKGAQFEFTTLTDIHKILQTEPVPKHHIGWSEVAGSSWYMAHQGNIISDE